LIDKTPSGSKMQNNQPQKFGNKKDYHQKQKGIMENLFGFSPRFSLYLIIGMYQ